MHIRTGCTHTHTLVRARMPPEVTQEGTKSGMLPGISQQHNTRSKLYWFTEFCNSQRLSHFAAPFIVVQAETSIAESCENIQHNQCTTTNTHVSTTTNSSLGKATRLRYPQYAALENPHKRCACAAPAQNFAVIVQVNPCGCVRMILPQVHLRKPCYDFSFL